MAKKRPSTSKPAHGAKKTGNLLPRDYGEVLAQLKERIRGAIGGLGSSISEKEGIPEPSP